VVKRRRWPAPKAIVPISWKLVSPVKVTSVEGRRVAGRRLQTAGKSVCPDD
jgi:hypothetical protein